MKGLVVIVLLVFLYGALSLSPSAPLLILPFQREQQLVQQQLVTHQEKQQMVVQQQLV
jgi:hypothetical protein